MNGSLPREAWQLFVMHLNLINNYTVIHVFQGVDRSQEPGCDKHGVNDTYCRYHYFPAIVMIDVRLSLTPITVVAVVG